MAANRRIELVTQKIMTADFICFACFEENNIRLQNLIGPTNPNAVTPPFVFPTNPLLAVETRCSHGNRALGKRPQSVRSRR